MRHSNPPILNKRLGLSLLYRHKAALPLDGGDGVSEAVLDVPEHGRAQVKVMLHKPHASISWPALLVVVAHNVLIVGVRVLRQVPTVVAM